MLKINNLVLIFNSFKQFKLIQKKTTLTPLYIILIFSISIIHKPVLCAPSSDGFWSFQLENDLWGSNDDRFYTNGAEVSFAYTDPNPAPVFLQRIVDSLPFYHIGEKNIHSYGIGQKIFTPEDISSKDIVLDDRPYAGWLFFEAGIAHVYEDSEGKETINGLLFNIGLIGPSSLGETAQKATHNIFNSDTPNGWDNQLQNELGINALYIRKWRNIFQLNDNKEIEFSHHYDGMLGNIYTYASTGMMLRWGTHLHNDIGPPTITPGFPGIPAFNTLNTINSWYFFSGLELRAIARNIFLDGNTLQKSHSVEKELIVADFQIGFAFYYKNMRISFSNLLRSKEFKTQTESSQYGAINVTVYSTN